MDARYETDEKRILQMQESHDLFMASLMLLLDVSRNCVGVSEKKAVQHVAGVDKMIALVNDNGVDTEKKGALIKKVFMILDIYFDLLKTNDPKLFNLYSKHKGRAVRVTIIPGIDFGSLWDKFDAVSQERLWNYVKLMYISSSYMIGSSGNTNNVVSPEKVKSLNSDIGIKPAELYDQFWKVYPNSTLVTKKIFNPFEGVGENNTEYGLSDLLSGPKLLPDQTAPGGLGGLGNIGKLLGIEKMINMEDLAKQLKNITKEQIENATKSIKSLLGDVDENTSEMIDLMLTDITDELKKEELGVGNPLNNLVNIAQNVAHKMIPKIDSRKVDMAQVWNSTRNMASKCQDKDGKPIFDGPNNPLSLVTSLLEKQMNMNQFGSKNKNNKSGGGGGGKKVKPDEQLSEQEYMNECQDILKQLGLPNISPDKMKNMEVSKLISELGQAKKEPKKKTKKSKRK
ncbi:MAG: hypothetical protein Harvfovirus11_16 [Harvfovirus sp.]|uniref:Uncharacterized protein n=1 Tax=Harvfovirus sp. TaxID=2487768 RepID=A0A3G5A3A0_9VIRU|nr:MAG: hypothetical protein Harvfovirus11_16 [Harvfovirus sp.]